jgi:hypothetical protein
MALLGERLTEKVERIHKILPSDDRFYAAIWRRKLDSEKYIYAKITELRLLGSVKICTRLDTILKEDVRKEIEPFPMNDRKKKMQGRCRKDRRRKRRKAGFFV